MCYSNTNGRKRLTLIKSQVFTMSGIARTEIVGCGERAHGRASTEGARDSRLRLKLTFFYHLYSSNALSNLYNHSFLLNSTILTILPVKVLQVILPSELMDLATVIGRLKLVGSRGRITLYPAHAHIRRI